MRPTRRTPAPKDPTDRSRPALIRGTRSAVTARPRRASDRLGGEVAQGAVHRTDEGDPDMTYPPQGFGQGAPAGPQGAPGAWQGGPPQQSAQPFGYPAQPQVPAPAQRMPALDPRITYTGALVTALGVAGFFFGFGALWSDGEDSLSLFEAGLVLYPVLLLLGGLTALAAVWTRNTFGLVVSIAIPVAGSLTMLASLQGINDIGSLGWGYWMIFSLGWIMAALSLATLLLAIGRIGAPRQPGYARRAPQPMYPQQMPGYPAPPVGQPVGQPVGMQPPADPRYGPAGAEPAGGAGSGTPQTPEAPEQAPPTGS